MSKRKSTRKEMNVFMKILLGALIMAIMLAALSVIAGFVIGMQDDPLSLVNLTSYAVLLLTSSISGFALAKLSEEGQKLLVPMLSGLLFSLILLIVSVIACGSLTLNSILNFLCYMGVLFLFSNIGARARKGSRRSHAK